MIAKSSTDSAGVKAGMSPLPATKTVAVVDSNLVGGLEKTERIA